MTIEDRLRTEMTKLENLLSLLESFKEKHSSTTKCSPNSHLWGPVSIRPLATGLPDLPQWGTTAVGTTICKTCGVEKILGYNLVSEYDADPWSSLREDEEE